MTDPYIQINGTKIEVFDNELGAVRTLKQLSDGTYVTNIATGAEVTTGTDNTKIVTPKAIGDAKVIARAYLNGAQDNLTSGVWTKVLLDTENYDVGGNFASYKFVAPVTGYYQANGTVNFKNIVADKRYAVSIYINGVGFEYGVTQSSTTAYDISVSITDILYLTATQYVELYCNADCGANTVDLNTGAYFTFMSIHLLNI